MPVIGMVAPPIYAPPTLRNLVVSLDDTVEVEIDTVPKLGRLIKIFWLNNEPRGIVRLFSGGWVSASLTALNRPYIF